MRDVQSYPAHSSCSPPARQRRPSRIPVRTLQERPAAAASSEPASGHSSDRKHKRCLGRKAKKRKDTGFERPVELWQIQQSLGKGEFVEVRG